MKGGPIPRAECQAGGMACTKDCSYDKGLSVGGGVGDGADLTGPGFNYSNTFLWQQFQKARQDYNSRNKVSY